MVVEPGSHHAAGHALHPALVQDGGDLSTVQPLLRLEENDLALSLRSASLGVHPKSSCGSDVTLEVGSSSQNPKP